MPSAEEPETQTTAGSGDFSEVRLKLWWAHNQLTLLNEATARYVQSQPYETVIEDRPDLEGYRTTAKLREPPPPELALLAGDFLNSIQGALDYLAWQLVLREGGRPGRATYFPIKLPRPDGSSVDVEILDERRNPAIRDPAVLGALRAVQPHGDEPANHPLVVLTKLNGETKHRHLPLLIAGIPGFSV